MSGLRKKIEAMMTAITFAEEGELETARSMLKTKRRVLLAVSNSRIDLKTCIYALNTSQRISSSIDLLVVGETVQEQPSAALQTLLSQLQAEAIPYALIKRTGCLKQAILDYIDEEDNTLFVIVESQETASINCGSKDQRLAGAWRRLKCPLVVVAEGLKS